MSGPPSLPHKPHPNGSRSLPLPTTAAPPAQTASDRTSPRPAASSSRSQPPPPPLPPLPPPPLPGTEPRTFQNVTTTHRLPPGGVPLPPAQQHHGTPTASTSGPGNSLPSPAYTPTQHRPLPNQQQQFQQHNQQNRALPGQSPVMGNARAPSPLNGQPSHPINGSLLLQGTGQPSRGALPPSDASGNLWSFIKNAEDMEYRAYEQRQAHLVSLRTHCTNITAAFNNQLDSVSAQHASEKGVLVEAKTQLSKEVEDLRRQLGQSTCERVELKSRLSEAEGMLKIAAQDKADAAKTIDGLENECSRLTDQNQTTSTALKAMTTDRDDKAKQLATNEAERVRLVKVGEETTAKCTQLEKQRDGYRTAHGKLKEAILQQRIERQRREEELNRSLLEGLDDEEIVLEEAGPKPNGAGRTRQNAGGGVSAQSTSSSSTGGTATSAAGRPSNSNSRAGPTSSGPSASSSALVPAITIIPATSPARGTPGRPASSSSASPPSRHPSASLPSSSQPASTSRAQDLRSTASMASASSSASTAALPTRRAMSEAPSSATTSKRPTDPRPASKRPASEAPEGESSTAAGKRKKARTLVDARTKANATRGFTNEKYLEKIPDESDPEARAEWVACWMKQLFLADESCKLCSNDAKSDTEASSGPPRWAGDEQKKIDHLELVHSSTWKVAKSGQLGSRAQSVGP